VVYTRHSVPPGCSDTRESEWHVSPTWYWQTSSSFFAAPLKLLSSKNVCAARRSEGTSARGS